MRKSITLAVLVTLAVAGITNASAIKVWAAETLRYVDLNANFSHIHNTMVGGHGARLVNADVSASAGITHSKLAVPALVPKAMVGVLGDCTANPCTMAMNSGFASINWTGIGEYTGTLSAARANTIYGVQITVFDATGIRSCRQSAVTSTTVFTFSCWDNAFNPVNTGFIVTVWDNDN